MFWKTVIFCSFIFIFFFIISPFCYSQEIQLVDYKGKITSVADGIPISGVAIVIYETGKNTVTDDEGNFAFKNVPKGKYKPSKEFPAIFS